MLHQRIWTDQNAEAEFWRKMERLEAVSASLDRAQGWRGILDRSFFRRSALARDAETIRLAAETLVREHTLLRDTAGAESASQAADEKGSALRTLAGLAVTLRQDRDTASGPMRHTAP